MEPTSNHREHRELVIAWVKEFYQQYQTIPPLRLIVSYLQQTIGAQANSIYLATLFAPNPLIEICKAAGLPKPDKCI